VEAGVREVKEEVVELDETEVALSSLGGGEEGEKAGETEGGVGRGDGHGVRSLVRVSMRR